MRYRKETASGDFVLSGTGNDYEIDNAQAVALAIKSGLTLFRGDWFGDTSQGMPWRSDVLGKYTAAEYDAVIKSQILATVSVQSITSYSSSYNSATRALSISVAVESIYGPVSVDTTL